MTGTTLAERPVRTERVPVAELVERVATLNRTSCALLLDAAEATIREGMSIDRALSSFGFAYLAAGGVDEDGRDADL